jgi:predicted nucleic acid-binding protein
VIAVDTNVLVRLLVGDDAVQLDKAQGHGAQRLYTFDRGMRHLPQVEIL